MITPFIAPAVWFGFLIIMIFTGYGQTFEASTYTLQDSLFIFGFLVFNSLWVAYLVVLIQRVKNGKL